jgi:hypothetical protein
MNHQRIRLIVSTALVVALTACTGSTGPGIEGSFAGTAVTPLPSPPLPEGNLDITAELRLDGDAGTFALDMDLSSMGLMDRADLRGTYVASNGAITLLPTGFEIDPASGNTAEGLCITLAGFAETPVCFDEMQDGEYQDASVTLTLARDIAAVPDTTTLTLSRTP